MASPATSPVPPAMPSPGPGSQRLQNAVLVNRPGRRLAGGRNRRVVVDRDHQAGGIAGHRVAVPVGRLNDRAKIDHQVVLGVVARQPVERRMVELINQREGPGPGRRVQREREDRVAGRRRRRHRGRSNRIAQRNAARGQA